MVEIENALEDEASIRVTNLPMKLQLPYALELLSLPGDFVEFFHYEFPRLSTFSAFVRYKTRSDAVKAVNILNGYCIFGKTIKVTVAPRSRGMYYL
jgi:RNA recognition motif-containing protein